MHTIANETKKWYGWNRFQIIFSPQIMIDKNIDNQSESTWL